MELILFLIAAGIIFYLYKTFQVYLSNPIMPNDKDTLYTQPKEIQQVVELSPKEKLKITEYGIITRILGRLSSIDHESCILEEKLAKGVIKDMAQDSLQPEELFLEIYKESYNEDIQDLATQFAAETIAQYKKRLKIVEMMFALCYADGVFTQEEEDAVINVAAILEIENDDFNKLYDEFKEINQQEVSMSTQEALHIFNLSENFTQEELEERYNQVVAEKRQNILDVKNLTRSYNEFGGQDLKKYSQAYALLLAQAGKKTEQQP